MENLNAEQIIETYRQELAETRVALAEANKERQELTEENERLRAENEILKMKRANIFEISNAFERGRADGVRKMQESVKDIFNPDSSFDIRQRIDEKAIALLEGKV